MIHVFLHVHQMRCLNPSALTKSVSNPEMMVLLLSLSESLWYSLSSSRHHRPLTIDRGGREDPLGSFLPVLRFPKDLNRPVKSPLMAIGGRPGVHQALGSQTWLMIVGLGLLLCKVGM